MFDDHNFALCLTHDVDRPYKTYQSLYYAVRDRRLDHLLDVLPGRNTYWQFDDIMSLEDEFDVRSAFYVLNEPHLLQKDLRAWFRLNDWIQHLGRYDIEDTEVIDAVRDLDSGGWEVGLHGSYRSFTDVERLRREKQIIEDHLDGRVVGGRQHHLNLSVPETWRHHADIGLRYDTSLGSRRNNGFQFGYEPLRPFGGGFVVFPLTLMEVTLPDPSSSYEEARSECEALLTEAAENDAVMTVLWHPRYFSESDFPGYRRLYRWLIQRALEMGGWVGSPAECYEKLDLDGGCIDGYDHVRKELTMP